MRSLAVFLAMCVAGRDPFAQGTVTDVRELSRGDGASPRPLKLTGAASDRIMPSGPPGPLPAEVSGVVRRELSGEIGATRAEAEVESASTKPDTDPAAVHNKLVRLVNDAQHRAARQEKENDDLARRLGGTTFDNIVKMSYRQARRDGGLKSAPKSEVSVAGELKNRVDEALAQVNKDDEFLRKYGRLPPSLRYRGAGKSRGWKGPQPSSYRPGSINSMHNVEKSVEEKGTVPEETSLSKELESTAQMFMKTHDSEADVSEQTPNEQAADDIAAVFPSDELSDIGKRLGSEAKSMGVSSVKGTKSVEADAAKYVSPGSVSDYQGSQAMDAAKFEVLTTIDGTERDNTVAHKQWGVVDPKAEFTDETAEELRTQLQRAPKGSQEYMEAKYALERLVFERTGMYEKAEDHIMKHSPTGSTLQDDLLDSADVSAPATVGEAAVERDAEREKHTVAITKYNEMIANTKSMINNIIGGIDRDEDDVTIPDYLQSQTPTVVSRIPTTVSQNASLNMTQNASAINATQNGSQNVSNASMIGTLAPPRAVKRLCTGNSKSDADINKLLQRGGCEQMAKAGLCKDVNIGQLVREWCEKSCESGPCKNRAAEIYKNWTTTFANSDEARGIDEERELAGMEYSKGQLQLQIEADRMEVEAREQHDEREAKVAQRDRQRREKEEQEQEEESQKYPGAAAKAHALVDQITSLKDEESTAMLEKEIYANGGFTMDELVRSFNPVKPGDSLAFPSA